MPPRTTPRAFVYRHAKTLTPFLSTLHLVPSALAVGERETALGTPPYGTHRAHLHTGHTHTHTHRFPMRPEITWTSRSHSFGSTFGRTNPKHPPPDHPGGAGSCTITRKPTGCTKVPLFSFFFVCFVPLAYHTHTPYGLGHFEFCVFSRSLFRVNGAT